MAVRSCGSTVVIYSGVAIVFSWESYNSLFMDSVSSSTAGHRASSFIFSGRSFSQLNSANKISCRSILPHFLLSFVGIPSTVTKKNRRMPNFVKIALIGTF